VAGRLGDALLSASADPILRWSPETLLHMPDRAALCGLLHRLQQDGLEIAEVRRMPARPRALSW
jgi:hypothetical protein